MNDLTRKMIEHYKESKFKSDNLKSNLPESILEMEGMTSPRTRHFYNNILNFKLSDRILTYLEVGSWKGSSLISALYKNNHVKATCIDNWSEFGGPKKEFISNCSKFLNENYDLTIIENDCFNVKLDEKFDVYMYDGAHDYESQFKAIKNFENNLQDSCLIIIDDWNHEPARIGTLDALSKINFNIKLKEEIYSKFNGDLDGYWNGMGIFVLERIKK